VVDQEFEGVAHELVLVFKEKPFNVCDTGIFRKFFAKVIQKCLELLMGCLSPGVLVIVDHPLAYDLSSHEVYPPHRGCTRRHKDYSTPRLAMLPSNLPEAA
jgi:hypothetical protein